jgi:predicted TIM-barrel fold metal-dependent hydrolase
MRVIDVDAHFCEPCDWMEQSDPELVKLIGPMPRFVDLGSMLVPDPAFAVIPEELQPKTGRDLMPPGMQRHMELSADLFAERSDPEGDERADFYDADARLRLMDAHGIDIQFLNATYGYAGPAAAAMAGRLDLMPRAWAAWNTWATDQVEGHTDRLIPVTQIRLGDLDWSIAEMTRMRERGSRAFIIPEAPVTSAGGKSITHPDFEPLWSAAEDLGMAAFGHFGFTQESINVGWAHNGRGPGTYGLLSHLLHFQVAPQLLLSAMVYDGVFERHPKLTVVMEEVGIDWLPYLVSWLDRSVGRPSAVDQLMSGGTIPDGDAGRRQGEKALSGSTMAGDYYKWPLAPSEYLSRQVRVTPLPSVQTIHPVLDLAPPELLCFSSDYPHVEGVLNAVELCDAQLVGAPDGIRDNFFGGVGDLIGV